MNSRELYLNALTHKPTDRVPIECIDNWLCGFETNQMEKGYHDTGRDGFGVRWEHPSSGGGTAIPAPGEFLFDSDSICDWEKYVKFPDPAAYHWAEDAASDLSNVEDRDAVVIDYSDGNGPFERLAAFMGFEEALVAMAIEPEATKALVEAIADFKIACMDYMVEAYHPDTYTIYDDVCTQRAPFMSVETYREILMPAGKRITQAAREHGMIPGRHNCGFGEPLVPSFIEEGYVFWESVQPCNDIAKILEQYGDQIVIVGGYDTNGTPGSVFDPEINHPEVERCFAEYGRFPSYIFGEFIMRDSKDLAEGESPDDASLTLGRWSKEYSIAHPEYRLG